MDGVEDRYHDALTALGVRRRWYETATDHFYVAVIAAVDRLDHHDILTRSAQFDAALPAGHDLHLIKETLAAITAARRQDVAGFLEAVDEVSQALRDTVRSKRFRRVAGAVVAATNQGGLVVAADQVASTYRAWNESHRLLTGPADLSLAAVTVGAGLDPATALDRAEGIDHTLSQAGYKNEWDLARILSLDGSARATERFLRLADAFRGRRRKPISDRRHLLAIASLAHLPPDDLVDVMAARLEAVAVGRFRPVRLTRLRLAAVMTLGATAIDDHRAFHGFLIREHFAASYAEATAD